MNEHLNLHATSKQALRREIRRQLRGVSVEDLAAASREICAALLAHEAFQAAQTIAMFAPLAEAREVDLTPLLGTPGKVFAFPRVLSTGGMDFCVAGSPTDLVSREIVFPSGRHVILHQPPADAHPLDLPALDLVLVPGLAFTRTGERLGRGGGFYDRFLASASLRAVKIGIGLTCQVVNSLPTEAHDHPLDALITAG